MQFLRNYLRQLSDADDIYAEARVKQSFAPWMNKQINLAWPTYAFEILLASQQNPPMTLRVNALKVSRAAYLKRLQCQQINALTCAVSPVGLTLKKPCAVNTLPNFDQGWVSVQDESAQLAVPLMDLQSGHRVLDACASPGGKSLHILETGIPLQELVCLDLPARQPRLKENLARAQAKATRVAGDLLDPFSWWKKGDEFDRILLDVPCTGTGVMRRHPDIKIRRSAQSVLQFAAQQRDLLNHAWSLLKIGGKLLYTTCSILPVENEEMIRQFLSEHSDATALSLPEALGFATENGRQRLPGIHAGDGFYYALLLKKDTRC